MREWIYTEADGKPEAYNLAHALWVRLEKEKKGELIPACWWLVIGYPEGPVRVPLILNERVIWSKEELAEVEAENERKAKHAFRGLMSMLGGRDPRTL